MHFVVAIVTILSVLTTISNGLSTPKRKQTMLSLKSHTVRRKLKRSHYKEGAYNFPLRDWFYTTDLQWFGDIEIGTPPQKLYVYMSSASSLLIVPSSAIFDTGSADIQIPSASCHSRGCTSHRRFDSSISKTFEPINQSFTEAFGDGLTADATQMLTANGAVGNDVVSIGSLSIEKMNISLITNQSIEFALGPADGIVGLGYKASSSTNSEAFFQQLLDQDQVSTAEYGFYMSPVEIGGAELTLGGIDRSKVIGPAYPLPVDKALTTAIGILVVNFSTIIINGKDSNISGPAIVDTGTTTLLAPNNEVAAEIYSLVSPDIQLLNPLGIFGMPCEKFENLEATIQFKMGHSIFTVPSTDFLVGLIPASEATVGKYAGMNNLCQCPVLGGGLGGTFSGLTDLWVIGASILKRYYSIWHYSEMGLSLARTPQSPPNPI